jgi:hypothetical protein
MHNKLLTKIDQFLNQEFIQNINDIAIFQNEDGSYELFNRYRIVKDSLGYKVTTNTSVEVLFSSLKFAVSWCILETRNKYVKAKRIEYLDQMLAGVDVSIEMHKHLIKKSKETETKLIYIAKLSEEQSKRKKILGELHTYINESKSLQIQKFAAK